eukprot:TRINITY_DN13008_c0_g1_i3.p1 TRINITY_DN13008_c0_g1~~TRINITY_DN13008_c0_g1_i3.p1  ORF type:complete len:315 (+),score=55.21 TRINITY_DN13008_c0_g1_i3:64-1008(+)
MCIRDSQRSLTLRTTAPQDNLPQDFWKQALRMRLQNALKSTRRLATMAAERKEKEALSLAASQIEESLQTLASESNDLVLEKLKNSAYTKEATNIVKENMNRIGKLFLGLAYSMAWARLREIQLRERKRYLIERMKSDPNTFYGAAYSLAIRGDYIIKANIHSNYRKKKFVRLLPDEGILKWASSEDAIRSVGRSRIYHLHEVEGLLLGRLTATFKKDYNKKLEPWLCLSIVLHNRTLDFYMKEEQMNLWYYVLSTETKRYNPRAYVPSFGRFLWRKCQMLMMHFFLADQLKSKRGRLTFVKALVAYKLSGTNN